MGKIKGQQEQECLDKVKQAYSYNKNCFAKEEAEAIRYSDKIIKYGFRYNAGQKPKLDDEYIDFRPIAKLLESAINTDFENEEIGIKKTAFPDFRCSNGLIEHFQISGTNETDGGSQILKDRSKCDKDIQASIENGESHIEKSFPVYQSYDGFCASFKRNWEKHISKLRNYKGNKDCVCFMIESNSLGLIMNLEPDLEFQLGILTGNIVEHYCCCKGEHFRSPLLGRCKELLEYIYKYKEEVQYVIFLSEEGIEMIKTDMSQYIAGLLGNYRFHAASTTESHVVDAIKTEFNAT